MNDAQALRTKSYRWLIWFLAGIVAISCLGIVVYLRNTMTADPTEHRYTQPYEYYLYVPRKYTAERSWPVFVGIHGSSGTGLHCWYWWQAFADKDGFILICPTLTDATGGWYQSDSEQKVSAIVSQVRSEYSLEERFYLAGFSKGAQLVQGYAFRYHQSVKGVAILSPGYAFSSTMNAQGISFLVVTGDRETPRRLETAQQIVSLLEQNNFNVEYHLLPGVGHTLTDETMKLTIEHFRKLNEQ